MPCARASPRPSPNSPPSATPCGRWACCPSSAAVSALRAARNRSRAPKPQRNSVEGLAALHHLHKAASVASARLRTLGLRDAEDERRAVLRGERREERGCRGARVERGLYLGWYRGVLLTVGGIPASVCLRAVDLGLAGGPHPLLRGEPGHVVLIDLRPRAPCAAGCVRLQAVVLVERAGLPVDPPEAQGDVQRLLAGDAGHVRLGLEDLHPHAVVRGVVLEKG